MKKNSRIISILILLSFIMLLAACGQENRAQNDTGNGIPEVAEKTSELTVSAAASLKDALEEIKTAYSKEKSNVAITYNFGGSGSLQQQIEQGAAVDLFISAAEKQMDALKDKGLLLEDTRKDLLGNRLVLVVPADSTNIADFKDLTKEQVKKIALGEPKSVPAGQYGEQVFTNLKIYDELKPKFIYGKDVKEVLTWVETGNADAGVVYETDAKASVKVKVAAIASEDLHKPIVYPVSVLKESKNQDAAKEFLNYLCREKAKPVFEKYGFSSISN